MMVIVLYEKHLKVKYTPTRPKGQRAVRIVEGKHRAHVKQCCCTLRTKGSS